MRALLLAAVVSTPVPVLALDIDGRIDPAEWSGAQRIDDFRMTQPLTRDPSRHATEAWYMATADGLAIAFRNLQPAHVPRTRQRSVQHIPRPARAERHIAPRRPRSKNRR